MYDNKKPSILFNLLHQKYITKQNMEIKIGKIAKIE